MWYDDSMWIDIKVGSTNIKNDLNKKKGRKIVQQAIRHGVTVLGTNEVRDTDGLFPSQWRTAQGSESGMKGEAKIHFDQTVWEYQGDWLIKVSDSKVIPAATRWLIIVLLKHRRSGKNVYFWNLHAVAHIDQNGEPGWTGKGRLARLRKRGKVNPLVPVHKEEMVNLAGALQSIKRHGDHIVGFGDLNVDAKRDGVRQHPDFPFVRLGRINMRSVFRAKGFSERPTKGRRYIDYIWAWFRKEAEKKHFRVRFLNYNVLPKAVRFGQDHKTIVAKIALEFPTP